MLELPHHGTDGHHLVRLDVIVVDFEVEVAEVATAHDVERHVTVRHPLEREVEIRAGLEGPASGTGGYRKAEYGRELSAEPVVNELDVPADHGAETPEGEILLKLLSGRADYQVPAGVLGYLVGDRGLIQAVVAEMPANLDAGLKGVAHDSPEQEEVILLREIETRDFGHENRAVVVSGTGLPDNEKDKTQGQQSDELLHVSLRKKMCGRVLKDQISQPLHGPAERVPRMIGYK